MVKLSAVRRLCFVRGGKECTPTAIFLNGDLNVRGEEAGDGEGGKNEKERGGSFVLFSVAVKKKGLRLLAMLTKPSSAEEKEFLRDITSQAWLYRHQAR